MNEFEKQEFFKFAKKLDSGDWALPWANEFYTPDSYEGISESWRDISFARDLEGWGTQGFGFCGEVGILAPKDEINNSVYYPLRVIVDYNYSISAEGIEKFLKGRLRFGDRDQIALIKSYSYLKLFEKYQPYMSLILGPPKNF